VGIIKEGYRPLKLPIWEKEVISKMGLAMRAEKGKHYPVLTCDTCGKPIEDWRLAITSFPWPGEEAVVVQVFHKGDCDPGGAKRIEEYADILKEAEHIIRKREARLWQPLDHYLPWLLWNHKWGSRRSTKQGDKLTLDVPRPLNL